MTRDYTGCLVDSMPKALVKPSSILPNISLNTMFSATLDRLITLLSDPKSCCAMICKIFSQLKLRAKISPNISIVLK